MNYQEPDPEHKKLEAKLLNAPTAEDVNIIRQEAFHKKFYDLVNQGRQMLLFSFGWKKSENGTLTPPQA